MVLSELRYSAVMLQCLSVGIGLSLCAVVAAGLNRKRADRSFDARIRLKKDLMVSKSHASVYFDGDEYTWNIVDLGSTHGTVLIRQDEGTGTRLSQPKVASTPRRLFHLE